MGIDGIEISKLSGKLQQLANVADNGNGILEKDEIKIFKDFAQTAVENGQVSESDYKAIFGSEIKNQEKSQGVTNPQHKTYTKDAVKQMESYAITILNEEVANSPENLLSRLTERLGTQANDPYYKDLQNQVKYIMDAVNEIGYKSKDDVEDLEKKVKEKLFIGKSDKFAKEALKALVKNAEYVQSTKEYNEIKEAYNTLTDAGVNAELAFDQVKKEFKSKGSYYKDQLDRLEKSYIMPKARQTVRDAIYESDATKSKRVKQDAKETLISDGEWNKYTEKALGGENNFGEWISGKDSDMKITRKNQARKNVVIDIRENGLTGDEIHDAVDKRKTFLFFKKKTQLFEALVSSGLITDLGNGKYDVSALSELIGLHVGANYKMDRTSSDYKALAEKTKTTSALAAATELKNLTEDEAKMLVEMCGYKVEGKNLGKAILGATIGALVNGLGAAGAAATNPRAVAYNNDHFELNLDMGSADLDKFMSENSSVINSLKDQGGIVNIANGVLQIIIDKNDVRRFSKFILETGLKSSIIGAAAGLIAGLKDDPEKPITSTQFECTTLEEYAQVLESEAKQKALAPEYKDALMLIALSFMNEDGSWNCDEYKSFLNKAAGNGGVLNREELLGALGEINKKEEIPGGDEQVNDEDGEEDVICENCNATKGKEQDTYADVKIPTIKKSEAKTWAASAATFYPCLVQAYGPGRAAQLLKAAQAVTDGDYSAERLLKMIRMSVADIRKMDDIEGFDKEYYIGLRLAEDLPDNVFVPDSIAGCDKKQNVKVGKVTIEQGGKIKAPTTDFTGYKVKTADGREYVDFCDGSRTYVPAGKTAEDVCRQKEEELRQQGKNVKITLQ